MMRRERCREVFHLLADWFLNYIELLTVIYLIFTVFSILFFLRRGDDIAFHLQRMDAIMSTLAVGG